MSASPDLETLIHAFLDNTITREDSARLKAMLNSSRADMGEFVRQLDIHVSLPEMVQPDATSEPGKRLRIHKSRSAPIRYAAAAILVLSLGALLYATFLRKVSSFPTPLALAHVSAMVADSPAMVIRAGQTLPVSPGYTLILGDRIQIASPGELRLTFDTLKMDVSLTHHADLTLTGPARCDLLSGRAEVAAAKRMPGQDPLSFHMPSAQVYLVGTRFVIYANPNNSRVRVIEGSVVVKDAEGGGRTSVEAGEVAWVHHGRSEIHKQAYSPGKPVEGDVLFADDFEASLDRWTPMILTRADMLRPCEPGTSPFARWKKVNRDGQETGCMELMNSGTVVKEKPAFPVDGDREDPVASAVDAVMIPAGLPFIPGGFVIEADAWLPPGSGEMRFFTYTFKGNRFEWLPVKPRSGDIWKVDTKTRKRLWARMRVEYSELNDSTGRWTHRFEMKGNDILIRSARLVEARPPRTAICLLMGERALLDNVVIKELMTFD